MIIKEYRYSRTKRLLFTFGVILFDIAWIIAYIIIDDIKSPSPSEPVFGQYTFRIMSVVVGIFTGALCMIQIPIFNRIWRTQNSNSKLVSFINIFEFAYSVFVALIAFCDTMIMPLPSMELIRELYDKYIDIEINEKIILQFTAIFYAIMWLIKRALISAKSDDGV